MGVKGLKPILIEGHETQNPSSNGCVICQDNVNNNDVKDNNDEEK